MASKKPQYILVAPVPFADAQEAGQRFLLLRYGRNEFTKGDRDGAFDFAESDADAILADFARRGKDLVVDYEHATLSGNPAPASGWIERLEKGEDGLYAFCRWTERGAAALAAREYRYHSPTLFFGKGGRPSSVHSVALTNHPALHSYPALVADDNQGETHMNETLKKLLEALAVQPVTLDDGAIDEEATAKAATDRLAALTDAEAFATAAREFLKLHESETFDDLTGRIKGMVPAAEKAELESRLARIEAEKAVAKAFTDGKLVEAQREWALGYAAANPQGFADFCAKASRVAPGPASGVPTGNPPANSDASHAHEFSDAEKAILRNLSLTDEQLAELKKEN